MNSLLLLALTATLCAQDRVEYPHSITPGGLQPGFLRLYPHRDMVAWVNYRGDDGRIHWTDKQVSIPERETVLVDRYGNLYRGRCGNNITLFPPKKFVPPPDLDTPHVEIPIPPRRSASGTRCGRMGGILCFPRNGKTSFVNGFTPRQIFQ